MFLALGQVETVTQTQNEIEETEQSGKRCLKFWGPVIVLAFFLGLRRFSTSCSEAIRSLCQKSKLHFN